MLLASLQALQALAIDIMLPALGAISADFAVSNANDRQLIVGVFLISAGLGSLVPGSLADRFGRKAVIVFALCAYVVFSLVCALVPDFTLLLVARGMMGFFSAALMVLPMTVMRDRFEGDQMARTQSLVAMTFMIVPMIAPMLGQAIQLVAGWRWIFGVMAVLGTAVLIWTLLRLPETLHTDFRQEIRPLVVARNMTSALLLREAVGYIMGAALIQAALFGYINSAQQLVGEHFGAGTMFPAVFGGMALVMASTNFINSRIVERFGARRVSQTALIVYIVVAAIHLGISMEGSETLWVFVPLMTIGMCMMSFIGANFQAISLQPFARTAGAAASVVSFLRLLVGATLGALIGRAYDGTAVPIFAAMTVAGIVALGGVLYSERGRLFRRLNYPAAYYAPGDRPEDAG
ncbi:Bcr/CflA family drug resistance efflux transporter [Novosphingobium endophyticum]|uniref:Bcr/CflA family drug resistance efflux transporter n=1 Tax=Novosphingobium endophyticum TaxID=1955250 RepID=A0A916TTL4_9SPHN|nr:multidrug effflux MFS transporter [Novosphingobium endophyticum]GGC05517.1 Bcr/CflA family drug resistance efflux transporter [Novosphingobium endophyticum]